MMSISALACSLSPLLAQEFVIRSTVEVDRPHVYDPVHVKGVAQIVGLPSSCRLSEVVSEAATATRNPKPHRVHWTPSHKFLA